MDLWTCDHPVSNQTLEGWHTAEKENLVFQSQKSFGQLNLIHNVLHNFVHIHDTVYLITWIEDIDVGC